MGDKAKAVRLTALPDITRALLPVGSDIAIGRFAPH
jgi:hypothetical protein